MRTLKNKVLDITFGTVAAFGLARGAQAAEGTVPDLAATQPTQVVEPAPVAEPEFDWRAYADVDAFDRAGALPAGVSLALHGGAAGSLITGTAQALLLTAYGAGDLGFTALATPIALGHAAVSPDYSLADAGKLIGQGLKDTGNDLRVAAAGAVGYGIVGTALGIPNDLARLATLSADGPLDDLRGPVIGVTYGISNHYFPQ